MNHKNIILADLHNIVGKEEMFWRQSSRVVWLKEGDKNSRFFHLSTLKHRTTNRIYRIRRGEDTLKEDKDIAREVVHFFYSILSKEHSLGEVD